MYLCEVEDIGQGQRLSVDFAATDDIDLAVAGKGYGVGERGGPFGARRAPVLIAGDDDVAASRQRSRGQRVESLAPHHEGMPHGERLEAAQILADVEKHVAAKTDGAVLVDSYYYVYHTETSAFM